MSNSHAFVTVILCENEAIGAMVLADSLRRVGTTKETFALVSNDISELSKQALTKFFHHVEIVAFDEHLNDVIKLRPDLHLAFFRFQCWKLTRFTKCVYLAPSCLVMQNVDELFARNELSAAPDTMWPDHFNCGVFVYVPSDKTYSELVTFSQTENLSDVSCQNILNLYFKNWATEDISKHLPFIYNVTPNVFYTYQPALQSFADAVKIIHFRSEPKPWKTVLDVTTGHVSNITEHQQPYYKHWWKLFNESVKPVLDDQEREIVHVCHYIKSGMPQHHETPVGDAAHKRAWERGEIDYLGKDSFDNIKKAIDKSINGD